MDEKKKDNELAASKRTRAKMKKYSKMARTSMLAITMGMSWNPAHSTAAPDSDSADTPDGPELSNTPAFYKGNSLAYFKNQFLPNSGYNTLGDGETAPTATNVAILGTVAVGQTLTGSYTYDDLEGDTESGSMYQWYWSDDAGQTVNYEPIPNATGSTYVLTELDHGKYITFEVTPRNNVVPKDGIPEKSAAGLVVAAPTATNVAITGTAEVGETLTGTYTYGDLDDGDTEIGSTYQWYRSDDAGQTVNYVPIADATGSTYTLTTDDHGKFITFVVTPRSNAAPTDGAAAKSPATLLVVSAPTATNVAITGTATVGETLTGTYTYGDLDNDSESGSTYQWYRSDDAGQTVNYVPIADATGSTYVLTTADHGKYITFVVTPRAGVAPTDGAPVKSEAAGAVVAAPTATNVAITGTATVGETLTGTYTYGDLDGDTESGSTYQWYRSDDAGQTVNYVAIADATGSTYTLTTADHGKYITFVVTPRTGVAPTDGAPAKSEAAGAVVAAPTATNVAITGTATVGETLTGTYTYGDLDGDTESGSTYQWYRSDDAGQTVNYVAIADATGSTYTLTTADHGKYITFVVTPRTGVAPTDGASAKSEAAGAVVAAPTATNVAISGAAWSGLTLAGRYTYGDLDGDTESGSTYQWYRSDDYGQTVNYEPIGGATGSTYSLSSSDVGKYITFVVTPRTGVAPTDGMPAKSAAVGPVRVPVPQQVPDPTPSPAVTGPQEEEFLIEVVALKENEETRDSAKLTVSRDEQGISIANFNFITDGVVQSSEDATAKDTIAVRAPSLTGARTVVGNIDATSIAALQSRNQRLAILTGDVAISFPTVSIPLETLANNGGVAIDQLKIEIKIEKQPEAVKTQAGDWAAAHNWTVVGEPYKFSIQVSDGTTVTPIVQYGNRYAYHTVPIPEGVTNPNSLGAVMLLDGKYVEVPVRIVDSGHALIHTPTNATVILIQRNESYGDLSSHWGRNDIQFMGDKGNVEANDEGLFDPGAEITRAEFADLLVKAFGLGHQTLESDTPGFSDLPADAGLSESIRLATAAGLFKGISDGVFAPDRTVTREQMIAVLMRFYTRFELEADPTLASKTSGSFSDMDRTSGWAQEEVTAADEAGILSGYENGTIRPLKAGTRAEAAALIRRFLQLTSLTN